MKKTLNAIAKLANSSHFLTSNEFPNAKNSEKCRCSLALIDDLTNRIIAEEENVSSIYPPASPPGNDVIFLRSAANFCTSMSA